MKKSPKIKIDKTLEKKYDKVPAFEKKFEESNKTLSKLNTQILKLT